MPFKKPQDTAYMVVERKHPDGRMSLFRCTGADPAQKREKLIVADAGRLAWVEMADEDVKPSLLYATSGGAPGPVPSWLQKEFGAPAEQNPAHAANIPDAQEDESTRIQDLWSKAISRSGAPAPEPEASSAKPTPPASKRVFIPDPGGAITGSGTPAADPATQDAWAGYLGH